MNQEQALTKPQNPTFVSLQKLPAALWLSLLIIGQAVFAWYIFALYTQPLTSGDSTIFNRVLNNLHVPDQLLANFSIALHLFGGAVISIIGPLQLIPAIREKALPFHRMLGRTYVITAMVISVAGMIFILTRGAVGGIYMDVGFALYGFLLFSCAVQTWRFAMAKQMKAHRRWAIRLFALGMASWLYRVEYGFWGLVNDGLPGHESGTFQGPFDIFMDFAFYIPTLMAVELYFYASERFSNTAKQVTLIVSLVVLVPSISLGCYAAAKGWWLPAIAG